MSPRALTWTVCSVGPVMTALVVWSPYLLFGYHSPSLHLVLDSVDACVALLLTYLLYGRFVRTRGLRDLLLAQGLFLLALASLGLGLLAGEPAMSKGLVARILNEFHDPSSRRLPRTPSAAARLTAREREVMQLLAEGKSTQEVAQQLFLSPTTIRVHVSTVLAKLKVKDRDSAFRLLRGE